jgi:hypothetical protein
MALKTRLQVEDIVQELILDSHSDTQISDNDIYFPQSDSDTEKGDRTDGLVVDNLDLLHLWCTSLQGDPRN